MARALPQRGVRVRYGPFAETLSLARLRSAAPVSCSVPKFPNIYIKWLPLKAVIRGNAFYPLALGSGESGIGNEVSHSSETEANQRLKDLSRRTTNAEPPGRAEEKSRPTVLIVDDDVNDLFMTERVIQKFHRPFHTAGLTNAQEAIDYLSGSGPYADRKKYPFPVLVIADLNMPCISGLRWPTGNFLARGTSEIERQTSHVADTTDRYVLEMPGQA